MWHPSVVSTKKSRVSHGFSRLPRLCSQPLVARCFHSRQRACRSNLKVKNFKDIPRTQEENQGTSRLRKGCGLWTKINFWEFPGSKESVSQMFMQNMLEPPILEIWTLHPGGSFPHKKCHTSNASKHSTRDCMISLSYSYGSRVFRDVYWKRL